MNLTFLYEELSARGAYRHDTQLCALWPLAELF